MKKELRKLIEDHTANGKPAQFLYEEIIKLVEPKPRYSVSLLYTKKGRRGSIDISLRVLVTYAVSEADAYGQALMKNDDDDSLKGYDLDMKLIIDVNAEEDDEGT